MLSRHAVFLSAITFAAGAFMNTASATGSTSTESAANDDPMQMIVSTSDQKMWIYKGTELIRTTKVSTGKRGHSTPRGVFSILEKRRRHFSNLYNNAPMPYMQRLTWSGIALHQGVVPGYPASHGCIRLPHKMAKSLFSQTEKGMHVIVAREKVEPKIVDHVALFQPIQPVQTASLDGALVPALPASVAEILPQSSQDIISKSERPMRVLITKRAGRDRHKDVQHLLNELGYDAGEVDGWIGKMTIAAIRAFQEDYGLKSTGVLDDQLISELHDAAFAGNPKYGHLYVRKNFTDVYDAPVELKDPESPLGTHMFLAMDFDADDREVTWTSTNAIANQEVSAEEALERVTLTEEARTVVSSLLTPGSSVIITDKGKSLETGKGTDFVVLTR